MTADKAMKMRITNTTTHFCFIHYISVVKARLIEWHGHSQDFSPILYIISYKI